MLLFTIEDFKSICDPDTMVRIYPDVSNAHYFFNNKCSLIPKDYCHLPVVSIVGRDDVVWLYV